MKALEVAIELDLPTCLARLIRHANPVANRRERRR
jgi:hypothetical protein